MGEAEKKWEPKIPDYSKQEKVDIEKVSDEYRKKLLEGSEEYQAGKEAQELIDGIAHSSKGEILAMKESMEEKLDDFKMTMGVMTASYENMMKEISVEKPDKEIIAKLANETENLGEQLLASVNKYLSELPELKDSELAAVRKEISNLYLDAGNLLEDCKRDSFSIMGKRKAAAI
jgi:ElaB/YqjD/DUF883 family membrane-anchored ribosome-binding protein